MIPVSPVTGIGFNVAQKETELFCEIGWYSDKYSPLGLLYNPGGGFFNGLKAKGGDLMSFIEVMVASVKEEKKRKKKK